jgi:hypothetical protein
VVNRSVNPSDRSVFQEPELELAEHVEGPVLDKEAHVIEEFHITKDVEGRTFRETLRNTAVEAERINPANEKRS